MNKKKQQAIKGRGGEQRGRSGSAVALKHGQKKTSKPQKNVAGGGAALQDIPLLGKTGDSDASDLEVSEEDLEFVEQHRRRLGFLETLDQQELDKSIRATQERQAKDAAAARQRAATAADGGESGSEGEDGDDDDDGDGEAEEDGDGEQEEAYERAPRRVKEDPRDKAGSGLPIKTLTGDVVYDKTDGQQDGGAGGRRRAAAQHSAAAGSRREEEMEAALAAAAAIQVEGVTITDDLEVVLAESKRKAAEDAARRAQEAAKKAAAAAKKAEETALPPALRGLNLSSLEPAARRAKLQEVMAAAAQKLLAAPESCVGELRTLQTLVADGDSMTSRLALLSLFAVFKDILPGYRIRPPTEKEIEVKVSKDVAKLREYEQTLLKSYQTYLRSLLEAAQCVQRGTGTLSHSRVAVRCLSGLLAAHPHFNYTSDILQAVVPRMAAPDPEVRSLACEAVRSLLEGADCGADEGGAGKAALEAVQLIADMVRQRKCVAPPEVVRTLSVLRFRDVARPGRGDEGEEEEGGKRRKGRKAEKREAKRRRKEDDVARAFKESAAGPDARELARLQSSMLEALFEIYFRVLKHCSAVGLSASQPQPQQQQPQQQRRGADPGGDGEGLRVPSAALTPPWSRARLLRKCPLLHPVLDGLAKYTHLISVDYMNDLLAVFSDLLAAPALPLPERLRLLTTLAALLRGQGEALNVDRRELYVQLYDTLLQVPFQSLLTDEPPNQRQQQAAHKRSGAGGDAVALEDEVEDDADVAMAASYDQAAEDAAAPPPPPAAAAAAGEAAPSRGSAPSVAALLGGVLEALLCEPKMADMQRTAAFVKRMAGTALMAGPGEAMALWAAVPRLLRRYPKLANLLEYEGEAPTVGGRTYDPFCADPSEAGGLATTLWEICLASGDQPHYHPHLAQAAASLMALRPGAAAAAAAAAGGGGGGGGGGGAVHLTGPLGTPATITELAEAYDASRGLMRPPPPPPAAGSGAGGRKGKGGRRGAAAASTAAGPSPEFLEAIAELAAEYGGGVGAGAAGWEDLELDSELAAGAASDDDAEQDVGDDVDENGEGTAYGKHRVANGGARCDRLGGGGGSEASAAAALRRMFLESRRFERNRQLRRDKALLVEQLKRFHIHLQQRQVAAAAEAEAAAAKAAAAAAAGRRSGGKPSKEVAARPQPPQPQAKGAKQGTAGLHSHEKERHLHKKKVKGEVPSAEEDDMPAPPQQQQQPPGVKAGANGKRRR